MWAHCDLQLCMFIILQVGYRVVPERKVTKPELGHLQKAGAPAMKHLREFKVRCCTCCTVHCVVWGDCTVAGRQQPAILHFAAQIQGLVEVQVEGPRWLGPATLTPWPLCCKMQQFPKHHALLWGAGQGRERL